MQTLQFPPPAGHGIEDHEHASDRKASSIIPVASTAEGTRGTSPVSMKVMKIGTSLLAEPGGRVP
jgi:hypothetical protein